MRVTFRSGDLQLEGELFARDRPTGAAVICHPHPLYGGNMDNDVVLAIDGGLRRAGYATLRFNFRGVGGSGGEHDKGVGEMEDVRAAVAEVLQRTGRDTCTLAGYSFGAMMVVHVAPSLASVARLIVVAPPLAFGSLEGLARFDRPKLFVVGDRDSYCGVADLERALAEVSEPKLQRVIAGADHFFAGYDDQIRDVVAAFVVG